MRKVRTADGKVFVEALGFPGEWATPDLAEGYGIGLSLYKFSGSIAYDRTAKTCEWRVEDADIRTHVPCEIVEEMIASGDLRREGVFEGEEYYAISEILCARIARALGHKTAQA